MDVFCSTIIATIGRPSLARAVESALAQTGLAAFEVVVVNDSGHALPLAPWQTDPRVRLLESHRRERCVARNAGAATARGAYLHFLDDDDWLLPGAIEAFLAATQKAPAAWYLGCCQLYDRDGRAMLQHRPELAGNAFVQTMAGEWLPLAASLIEARAFVAVGGFNPEALYVEDVDLARRMTLAGEVACLPVLVASMALGNAASTTNSHAARLNGQQAREQILDDPRCFPRLAAGAQAGYWHGRIVRCYLTSAWWNLRRARGLAALSRSGLAVAALLRATRHLLGPAFWRAIARAYKSPTFARGLAQQQAAA